MKLIPLLLVIFSISCGSWLGNPKEFGDTDKKKQKAEPEKTLELWASVSHSQTIPVKNRSGASTSLAVTEFSFTIENFAHVNGSNSQTIELASSSYSFMTGRQSLGSHPIQLSSVENLAIGNLSVYIVGTYQAKPFKLTIASGEISQDLKSTLSIENLERMLIYFKTDQWLDFSQRNLDLEALTGSNFDLSIENNETIASIRSIIFENIKSSIGYGKDSDGDFVLSEIENLISIPPLETPDINPEDSSGEEEEEDDD